MLHISASYDHQQAYLVRKHFEQGLIAKVTFSNRIRILSFTEENNVYKGNVNISDKAIISEILISFVTNSTLKPKKEVFDVL
jgi:hypothetical protein